MTISSRTNYFLLANSMTQQQQQNIFVGVRKNITHGIMKLARSIVVDYVSFYSSQYHSRIAFIVGYLG